VIYLDHNATAPLCEAALGRLESTLRAFHGNPSSLHRAGQRADALLEESRRVIATELGLDADRLIFTSGATEAANAIAHHFGKMHPNRPVAAVATEHACVLDAIRHHVPRGTLTLPVTSSGAPILASTCFSARPSPSAVFAMLANNETGSLNDLTSLVQQAPPDIPFAVDVTQAVGRIPLNLPSFIRDNGFVFASGHKIGAPIGIGFLHLPRGLTWTPLLHGGGQEEARRSGTQNAPLAAAFAAAIQDRVARFDHLVTQTSRRDRIAASITDIHPDIRMLGEPGRCLWNTVAFVAPELADCRHRWTVLLDKAGFAISSGSACSAGAGKASHVLRALGLGEGESDRTLRVSWGWETPDEHLNAFIRSFAEICTHNVPRGTLAVGP
jgi:cysteine desulfurase